MPGPEPAVVMLEPMTTAVIRRVVPMDRLPEFFDASFGALAATVTEQGVGVAGPVFALYHGLPTDTVDLEAGFPTHRTVRADGDVVASACPAAASSGRCTRVRSTGSARRGSGCAAGSTSRACGRGRPSGRCTWPHRPRTWIPPTCGRSSTGLWSEPVRDFALCLTYAGATPTPDTPT